MSTYMVWYDIGVSEKVKADSLRGCADKVRRTSNEREFLIVPLDYWKEFKRNFTILDHRQRGR